MAWAAHPAAHERLHLAEQNGVPEAAYMVMAYIVMAYMVMDYIVMAYIPPRIHPQSLGLVMAYMVMDYIVMACIVMS